MDVNQLAPDFTLPDQNREPVTLSTLKGKTIVLFFYPRADTPGCTLEACGFRDQYGKLPQAGLTLLGTYQETPKTQKKIEETFSLPYTLLADADKEVAVLYGVLKEKNMYGKTALGVERTTFFIAPDGTIGHIWRKLKPGGPRLLSGPEAGANEFRSRALVNSSGRARANRWSLSPPTPVRRLLWIRCRPAAGKMVGVKDEVRGKQR